MSAAALASHDALGLVAGALTTIAFVPQVTIFFLERRDGRGTAPAHAHSQLQEQR